ncbi:uncharacterized protein LOC106875838 [Octopus bimaculoides]|uniref:Uncharacterized protein n=1 Tax=Octopus bimaculoides TaxID=37653 RepID=A0A0L8GN02_OCTBM|nr:uncharacterized protein LOC106875838 [Octopus bimaculoides]|eukprot:XP_014779614.1 PREDICTED: uncharacterized protein LOC106875838 [Octopus bimaculoides]
MNRFMNRFRPQFNRKYRGFMEPMNMMSMVFQGRYMDSYGKMVDPKLYEFYGKYSDNDRYYGKSMYNYYGFYDNDRFHRNGNFMDFPERFMDMSGYQMDMNGKWMDTQGQNSHPYWNMFSSSRQGCYPGYSYGRNWFFPERFMDMSHYQMDMNGRYMDKSGRHCNPYYSYYRRYMSHPQMNFNQMHYPERFMDMSSYQMDIGGRYMDKWGCHINPFSTYYFGKQSYFPHNYWSQRKYMDMSSYQMDMQYNSMDMNSRNCDQLHYFRNFDMWNNQMDFDGHWMNMNNQSYHPSSFIRNQVYYNPYHFYTWMSRYYNHPEKFYDTSNYQVEFGGKWPSQEYECITQE